MKTLHLVLKREWFDAISSGDKREEYRDITDYWRKRLEGKHFDVVKFRNGYRKDARTMVFRVEKITVGLGLFQWGAPFTEEVFIIHLGERIE